MKDIKTDQTDQTELQKEYGSVLSYFSTPHVPTNAETCHCLSNEELDNAFEKLLRGNNEEQA